MQILEQVPPKKHIYEFRITRHDAEPQGGPCSGVEVFKIYAERRDFRHALASFAESSRLLADDDQAYREYMRSHIQALRDRLQMVEDMISEDVEA